VGGILRKAIELGVTTEVSQQLQLAAGRLSMLLVSPSGRYDFTQEQKLLTNAAFYDEQSSVAGLYSFSLVWQAWLAHCETISQRLALIRKLYSATVTRYFTNWEDALSSAKSVLSAEYNVAASDISEFRQAVVSVMTPIEMKEEIYGIYIPKKDMHLLAPDAYINQIVAFVTCLDNLITPASKIGILVNMADHYADVWQSSLLATYIGAGGAVVNATGLMSSSTPEGLAYEILSTGTMPALAETAVITALKRTKVKIRINQYQVSLTRQSTDAVAAQTLAAGADDLKSGGVLTVNVNNGNDCKVSIASNTTLGFENTLTLSRMVEKGDQIKLTLAVGTATATTGVFWRIVIVPEGSSDDTNPSLTIPDAIQDDSLGVVSFSEKSMDLIDKLVRGDLFLVSDGRCDSFFSDFRDALAIRETQFLNALPQTFTPDMLCNEPWTYGGYVSSLYKTKLYPGLLMLADIINASQETQKYVTS